MKEIAPTDARTHLPTLLREVAKGKCFSITRNGRPIAMLVPAEGAPMTPAKVIAEIKALRNGITVGEDMRKELIREGRRCPSSLMPR